LTPTGIASEEAIGTSVVAGTAVTQNVTGTGIASAEALGTSVVTPGAVNVTMAGLATAEALGAHTVTPGAVNITGTGLASEEAIGTSTITPGAVTLTLTGIVSSEAFGTAVVETEGTSTYYDDVMALSPTSYWRLGETSGTGAADEQSANPGTYYNSPTLGSDSALSGDDNTSITLDASNEYMRAGNDASLQSEFATIIVWFKTSGAGSGYRRFFSKDGAYGIFTVDNVFGTYIWGGYSGWKSSGIDVADGEWHMGALTIIEENTGSSELYLDGQLVWNNLGDVANQNWPLDVGDGHSLGQNPAASIDEAAIWVGSANILTGAEIAALYEAGTTTVTPPLAITATGIQSEEAIGSTTVTATYAITATGIASAEALGAHTVTPGAVNLTGTGIASAEALGTSAVTPGPVSVTGTGIASAEAIGTHTVTPGPVNLTGTGIASAETLGTSAVTSSYAITNAGGISSEAVLGGVTVTYTYPITSAGGISTQEALGATVLSATYPITGVGGIASDEALGTTLVGGAPEEQYLSPAGIPSAEAFGTTVVGHTVGKLTEVSDGLAALIRASSAVRNVYPMPTGSVTPTCAVIGFPSRIDYDLTFNCSIVEIELPIWFVVGSFGTKNTRDDLSTLIDNIKSIVDGYHSWGIVRVTKAVIDLVTIGQVSFITVRFNVEITD
jgi:hypothetical protein